MSISSRLVRMSRNHNIERLADKKHYEESGMNKLPEITIYFWIMKICATTLGETGGDLLSMTLNVGYATSSLILIGLFLIALVIAAPIEEISPISLLDCNPFNQYSRHNDVRLYGSYFGAWLHGRFTDIAHRPAGDFCPVAFKRGFFLCH